MKWFIALYVTFFAFVWLPVESAWLDFCFNNYDLGIYGQAIERLSFNDPNPWLSTRNVFLFNDHFDPILFFLIPFKGLIPSALLAIRMEFLAMVVEGLAPLWLYRRKVVSLDMAVLTLAILLFSPLMLDAAFYPAHPGTWSVAPLSWMFAFLLVSRYRLALLMLILTLTCKEEYPFVGLAIGAVLWVDGRFRESVWFLVASAVWATIVFVFRPWLLGPASLYTDSVSSFQGLRGILSGDLTHVVMRRILELGLPFIAFFYGQKKTSTRSLLIPFSTVMVFLAIRFAGGYWENHRAAPLAVALAYLMVFAHPQMVMTVRRRYVLIILTLALAFPSMEIGSRLWRGKSFKKHCPRDSRRIAEISSALNLLRASPEVNVIAQGNLIPPAVDLPGITHVGTSERSGRSVLFIELGSYRNSWPLTSKQLDDVEHQWRSDPNVKVLVEGQYVLVLERQDVKTQ
jgi:uncharacterized membrane protein